jgi:outer membrane biosynthesis protein TonB
LQSHRVSLTTDGKQLRLFRETPAPREEEVEPEPETTEEDEPRVEETRAAVPPPAPRATKKAARKKKAAKKAPRRKAAAAAKPAAVPPITPAKPREEPREAQSATERLAQIARNNESLYRDGIIDSTQAKMAGVDVEAVDASKGGGSALTEADLVALGEGSY